MFLSQARITAVLGPTNTGKTHYAIEQMLSYRSGIIGFPLRLLARENYDRVVKVKGPDAVALVTGEEKIVPKNARYYCCTVEAMPMDVAAEFVAVDEIQLCADPDRGHIFTDRLLHARGTEQTMFMGADTIRPLMMALVPHIDYVQRQRLSTLTYKGFKKMTRLPKRSAIVAFSIEDVYGIADLVRRQRGGTAVVLGALSPRTRNKQVDMYQAGEVDFLVATDAIGMGLNMDIQHVALASTRKFDGARLRSLDRAELAQIAGRAGRYTADGTFGVTGRVPDLDEDAVEAIENNIFPPLSALCWRNSDLDFGSPFKLLGSLDKSSGSPALVRGRPADDYVTLASLARRDEVSVRAVTPKSVELLWDVCQIPDFRKTLSDSHQELAASIYVHLMGGGRIPEAEVSGQIRRLDRVDGDVDTLMARIAHIRTWTYITHKTEWLSDAAQWQNEARAIEDKLSDALHDALTRRFVDRRAAVLMRAIEEGGDLLAGIKGGGEVVVEGQEVGTLDGFRFVPAKNNGGAEHKTIMAAARNALRPEIKRRIYTMLDAQDKQFQLNDDGEIRFQPDASNPLPGRRIAKVKKGAGLLKPSVEIEESDLLEGKDKEAVLQKLQEWLKKYIATNLETLVALEKEEGIEGTARGIAFQLYEAMGILPRAQLEDLIKDLDDAGRAALRARKVRLGPVLVFLPTLNKPAAVRLRALLWNLWNDKALPADVPPNGMTSFTIAGREIDAHYLRAIGYPVYGNRAIRVDMLDRLICEVYDSAKDGQFRAKHKMAEWLGCPIPDLYLVLESMGHTRIEEKEKKEEAAAPAAEAVTAEEAAPVVEAAAAETVAEAPAAETPAAEAAPAAPEAAAKPELALFRLRRGKAYGGTRPARPAKFHKKKEEGGGEKRERKEGGERREGKRPHDRKKDKDRDRKRDDRGGRDDKDKRGGFGDRVAASAAPKELAASPFAMLKNMKVKSGE